MELRVALRSLLAGTTLAMGSVLSLPVFAEPLPVAEVKRDTPVDFEKEILPILRRNCVACHSATEAESKFVVETPQTILKGGTEGPAIVPGNSANSLIFQVASHAKDPIMPPAGNDVKAKNLTADELGLLKLWIDQGAKGEVSKASDKIVWQPLPASMNAIMAVAVSPDGQYAAAARGNQIFVYHVASKRELGRLTDPSLIERGIYKNPGVADLDTIQALRFSPDGKYLASGGFRTAKLWRRPEPSKKVDLAALEGAPRGIALSADGKQMAIGEETGKIKIYDVASGQVSKTLQGHTGPVTGVSFSADGTQLVSGSQDKTCRLWNIAEQKELGVFENPAPINAVAICGEGKLVAVAAADNNLRLWNLPTPKVEGQEPPKPVKELGHGGAVSSVQALGAKGEFVATGCADAHIRLWDINSGQQLKAFNHQAPVESIAVSSDMKRFVTAGSNQVARIFNGDNGQQIAELKGNVKNTVNVGVATRAVNLAKRNVDSAKKDLDEAQKRKSSEEENQKKSMEEVTKTDTEFKAKMEAVKQPTADKEAADKALVEATEKKKTSEENQKKAGDAQKVAQENVDKANKTREEAQKVLNDATTAAQNATNAANQAKEAAAKDPNNADLAKAAEVAVKAAEEAEAKRKTADEEKQKQEKAVTDANTAKQTADQDKQKADQAFNEANQAFTQADQKVKQVTPPYQKAMDELVAAERNFKAAQRSVERAVESVKKAVEAIPGFENIVKQFEEVVKATETKQQEAQKTLAEGDKPWHGVAISPDGKTIATVGDNLSVQTWDVETGAPIEIYPANAAAMKLAIYLPDGTLLTAAANNAVTSWDFATNWKLERTIGSPDDATQIVDRVSAIDFSHDGKVLATGSGEPSRSGEIKFWSVENGQLVRALKEPHSDCVYGIEFSPDDQQIASCGADRFVKVFNVGDGSFVRSFEGHTHHVLGVSWRADGRVLVSGGADSVVKVWNVRTGDQMFTVQGFNKEVTSVRFVGETDQAVASSGANIVRMINAAGGNNLRDFGGNTDFVNSVVATPDGQHVVAGGQDSVLRVWRLDNAQMFHAFEAPKSEVTNPQASK